MKRGISIINSTIKNIKNIKIQGAENVAKYSIISLKEYLENIDDKKLEYIKTNLKKAISELRKTRPTEPCLQNVLNYLSRGIELTDIEKSNKDNFLKEMYDRIAKVMKHFYEAEDILSDIGMNKIKDGMIIFTHCHSSSVISILKKAKEAGKEFEVHNTETRPLFQGRKTSEELAKLGIPIKHFIDSAARFALKNCDLMLIGADALNTDGSVINKIGSELFAEIANKYDIPVYVITDSWKFDANSTYGEDVPIEKRSTKEIWTKSPKNVEVINPAFEIVSAGKITGVITELGIYRPEIVPIEVKKKYNWFLEK